MKRPLNRRQFVQSSLAVGAAALAPAAAGARASSGTSLPPVAGVRRPAEALVIVRLCGGVSAADTFDPKPYTPFRPGMRASELDACGPSIPTAIAGVRFGQGLEELAAVMDRGAVVRTVTSDLPHADEHAPAQNALMTGSPHASAQRQAGLGLSIALRLGARANGSPSFIDAAADPARPRYPLGRFAFADDDASHRFTQAVFCAPRWIDRGARVVQIDYPFAAYAGFDTHEHGGARMGRLKSHIDAPIAAMVRELEVKGLLESTLIVVTSEFGRTIQCDPSRGQDYVIRHERDYGMHAHHSGAWSALLFGGPVRRGAALGRTGDEHPVRPIDSPLHVLQLRELIRHAMGVGAMSRSHPANMLLM